MNNLLILYLYMQRHLHCYQSVPQVNSGGMPPGGPGGTPPPHGPHGPHGHNVPLHGAPHHPGGPMQYQGDGNMPPGGYYNYQQGYPPGPPGPDHWGPSGYYEDQYYRGRGGPAPRRGGRGGFRGRGRGFFGPWMKRGEHV